MSCRPAPLRSDYNTLASSATHLMILIVFIFNFTSSTFSTGKFRSCTVSLGAFLLDVLFLQCSDFVLHKHSRPFTKSSTNGVWPSFHLKPTAGYFQTDQQKINQTANKRRAHSLGRNTQWHVYDIHFWWFIQDDSSQVNSSRLRSIIHPTSWMIAFDGRTAHTVRF